MTTPEPPHSCASKKHNLFLFVLNFCIFHALFDSHPFGREMKIDNVCISCMRQRSGIHCTYTVISALNTHSFPKRTWEHAEPKGTSTDHWANPTIMGSHSTVNLSFLMLVTAVFHICLLSGYLLHVWHYSEHLRCITFLLIIMVLTLHTRKLRPREV